MYVLYINQSSKVFANVYTLKQVNSQIKLSFSVIMLLKTKQQPIMWLIFRYQLIFFFETLTIHNNYNQERKASCNAINHLW